MTTEYTNPTNSSTGMVRSDELTAEEQREMSGISPMTEIGATGLERNSGIINEEKLPALRGRNAVKVYGEMSKNDPMVGSMLFSMDKLIRNVDWTVTAASNSEEDKRAKEFIEQCMNDMSHSWGDFISEVLSMLVYGWSYHEIVYKRRVGPYERDPAKRSKYTDGMIGWRKIPIRAQETLFRWVFQDDGGIQGMIQMPPPLYQKKIVPINRALLFRTGTHKGNPEGTSVLRTAYRPYYIKKRLEEYEAIGVERDLAGLPVAWIPESVMNAQPGSRDYKTFQAFKKMVQNIRRDAHDGIVLPLGYWNDTQNEKYRFELMSSGGARQFDTNSLIQRYEQRILMSCLADFILLGHEGQGSYAMHTDKTGIFRTAINTFCESIADVLNRYAIPQLFQLNGWYLPELPKFEPANVDPPDLGQLTQFMSGMSGLGMQFFPDADLEDYLRNIAQLPDLPEEMQEIRRQMSVQQNHTDLMNMHMQAEGANQQMGMVKDGMSPEQAMQQQEALTPDQQMQQGHVEQLAQARGEALTAQDPDVQAHQQSQQDQELAMQAQQADQQMQQSQMQNEMSGQQQMQSNQLQAVADTEKEARGRTEDEKSKAKDHERAMQMEKLKSRLAIQQQKQAAKDKPADKPKPRPRSKAEVKKHIFERKVS